MKRNCKVVRTIGLAAIVLNLMSGCVGKADHWTLESDVTGLSDADTTVVVEYADNGRWTPVDTIAVKGTFKQRLKFKTLANPAIWRLSFPTSAIYFPVDSVESVSVAADMSAAYPRAVITGSTSASIMTRIDSIISQELELHGPDALASNTPAKREISRILLEDPASVGAYYTAVRRIADRPLYDPADPADVRVIGAVANAYATSRPNDPRTSLLEAMFIDARRAHNGVTTVDTIFASEVNRFDIKGYDARGVQRALSDAGLDGKVVVLNFISYASPESPALNLKLSELRSRYASRGLEIFQVCVDDDEHAWRESAVNVPWIAIYNSPYSAPRNLVNYNVTELPTTFVLNRQGEVVARVVSDAELESALKKVL